MTHRVTAAISAAVLFLLPSLSSPCFAEDQAGVVKTVGGKVSVLRHGTAADVVLGTKIFPGDRLVTGKDGTVGILFRDNSSLSLGHDTAVEIDRFLFSPAEEQLGLTARILRGTVAYLSGLIARLSPDSVKFETPEASIGIRGTHFAVHVAPER